MLLKINLQFTIRKGPFGARRNNHTKEDNNAEDNLMKKIYADDNLMKKIYAEATDTQ